MLSALLIRFGSWERNRRNEGKKEIVPEDFDSLLASRAEGDGRRRKEKGSFNKRGMSGGPESGWDSNPELLPRWRAAMVLEASRRLVTHLSCRAQVLLTQLQSGPSKAWR